MQRKEEEVKQLTVINEPHMYVWKALILSLLVGERSSVPNKSEITPGPSPARRDNGRSMKLLKRLVYQERRRALPSTTFKLCLMTTEWKAVMMELATPKKMPTNDMGLASKKTPMKNPMVTTVQATRIRSDGRLWRTTKDTPTVKGRTRPRAT